MSNPVSNVSYTGDGVTTTFTIPFVYVNRYDIQLFVNGTQTAFTWTSSGQISVSPAPVAGSYVFIDRRTVADTSGFNFQSGALRPADLNNAMRQCLYVAQEAFWLATTAFRRNLLGMWDALNSRIVDVADPIATQDATTMGWVTRQIAALAAITLQTVGGIWDARGERIASVADPLNPQDAATMNWVSNLVSPLASGLSAITANALQLFAGAWNATQKRISNVAAPVLGTDAATAAWVLEQVGAALSGGTHVVSKAAFLTALEANTPGSVATLVQNIPPDPSDPVNISFNHNASIVRGDVTYTFAVALFPSINMGAVATAAGL